MKKARKFLLIVMALPLLVVSCELLDSEPEEEKSAKVDNTTYTYTYTCSTGTKYKIEIPNRLSESCKKNWEYYARTYGCNDADNFGEAEKRKRICP